MGHSLPAERAREDRGRPRLKLLSDLADRAPVYRLIGEAPVRAVTDDSRHVEPGSLFFAVRGTRDDGHRYAAGAVAAGASALVVERPLPLAVAQLVVPSVRAAVGPLSACFYGDPSQEVAVVGVTGTNGKTTTSTLVRECLDAADEPAGQIGTVGTVCNGTWSPATMTTPRAPELQRLLRAMADSGTRVVAMEVSSHALDQSRVEGTHFKIGIFTNLTGEHLDYHGTMEHYWATKASLFESDRCEFAVVGVDDEWGARLAAQLHIPAVTFSTNGRTADVSVRVTERGASGIDIALVGVDGGVRLSSKLVGKLNGANVAAAYLAARRLGLAPAVAAEALAAAAAPPGRFEIVDAGQPFLVAIDYAHTPDALRALVALGRTLTGPSGRVAVVVGARGGRDRFKRPDTGRAAAEADRVVITADSPGDEPVGKIIEEIFLGTLGTGHRADVSVEPDRRQAIRSAVAAARPGDVVLVVGRGHEVVQYIGGRAMPFDDREVARWAIERRTLTACG